MWFCLAWSESRAAAKLQLMKHQWHIMLKGTSTDKLLSLDSRHVRPGNGFVPNFLLFEKGDVNGRDEQAVFTFLKVTFLLRYEQLADKNGV